MPRATRQSFGGKTGVWWRADGTEEEEDEGIANTGSDKDAMGFLKETETATGRADQRKPKPTLVVGANESASAWSAVPMGWDDDLCRPVYYQNNNLSNETCDNGQGGSHGTMDTSLDDDEEEQGDDFDDDGFSMMVPNDEAKGRDQDNPQLSPPSSSTTSMHDLEEHDEREVEVHISVATTAKRRNRTFGKQVGERRPMSLVLMGSPVVASSPASSSIVEKFHQEELQEDEHGITCSKRPRRSYGSSKSVLEMVGAVGATATSLSTTKIVSKPVGQSRRRISTSPVATGAESNDDNEVDEDTFLFRDTRKSVSAAANTKGKKRIVKRSAPTKLHSKGTAPNPRSSLDQARDYFAKLDETQTLTLDASQTPVVSSKVTRTTRTGLSSPGLQHDYQAYTEATIDLGVSPLGVEDYASSRRIHMRKKKELFDGFLDDEEFGLDVEELEA